MTLQQASEDYQRIAAAIAYLRAHHREQPSLAELAAHSGLSAAHFQRLFSRWAGISPKRFSQYLTVEYAKQAMRQGPDLLRLALDAGLSGPGRLHDLFVSMEAMSPGEYRAQAAGLELGYGIGHSPFGEVWLAFSERGVCHLAFVDQPADQASNLARLLQQAWPGAQLVAKPDQAAALAERIFGAHRAPQPISAWVVGSNLQIQVWRALLRLPPGGMLSYAQLAHQAGYPRAARAVGSAMAANPIGYLIPCHRVLRQSGEVGQYHWGSERKAAMLAWEAARLARG